MRNILKSLVWKYAGYFDADQDGGKYEIWFLITSQGDHIARFIRYNETFIENHSEFLQKQTDWQDGPRFYFHKWYKNALPWNEVRSQLDDGKILFGLSDSGTYRISFCDICTLEPAAAIEIELSDFDKILLELDLL